ncbi:hypothetical protein ACFL1X_05570 [Candidatus Hydrogenedentota bacterium]
MRISVAVLLVVLLAPTVVEGRSSYYLDFGPPDSPVAKDYERAGASDAYSETKGYGWMGAGPMNFVSPKPAPNKKKYWHLDPIHFYDEMVTPLRYDGCETAGPLSFRFDVPKGRYRVTATVGNLDTPRYSVVIYANGKLEAKRVDARHWLSSERGMYHLGPGYYKRVRFVVDVSEDGLLMDFRGDDREFKRLMADELAHPENRPKSHLKGEPLPENHAPFHDIGGPFTKVSIMALEVCPDGPLPLSMNLDTLVLKNEGGPGALDEAVALFNSHKFKEAEKAFLTLDDPLAKGMGLLAIVGRCDYENEVSDTRCAVEALRKAAEKYPDNGAVRELLASTEIFWNAVNMFVTRREPGKSSLVQLWRVIAELDQVRPDDFFYYKGLLWQARFLQTLDPHRWAWHGQTALDRARIVEKKFPDNRFVRYILYEEYENYGDGTHYDDWHVVDYTDEVAGSPEWVRAIYPAFRNLVDWCEWWVTFRQNETGGIGGGWGDDVEIVGAFGYVGYTGRGVSDILVAGTNKLVNGVWHTSEVDPELGYCLPNADAEHTAEWTGNTLGMMVLIDYGNPVWIERSMKTGKLMRDLWTSYNLQGNRHFRANFFGAAQVGGGNQSNDSHINYRAIRPAKAVFWYNKNPKIRELLLELADSWVDAAMSTARGKPTGVIPTEVAWSDGKLGGVNSPNWWTASHPKGTINYDWIKQSYKHYIQDLLITAFKVTGDRKYIEPLRLEYDLAVKYGYPPKAKSGLRLQQPPEIEEFGKRNRNIKLKGAPNKKEEGTRKLPKAKPGSEEWVAAHLKSVEAWLEAQRIMEGRKGELENDTTKDDIIRAGRWFQSQVKWWWPRSTTEAGPTDRIAFSGLVNPFMAYTGGRFGGPLLESAVTYENTTREFAAAVLGTDFQGFRLLYHSIADETREIGIVPWHLETGGRYVLRYGPDENEDELMDSRIEERKFDFPQLGKALKINVAPRKTYLIEVDQIERPKRSMESTAFLAPDPALTADDIRYVHGRLLVRIHNIGSAPAKDVWVAAYDGDPAKDKKLIGKGCIPNIEAPVDLEPMTTTIGFNWSPTRSRHEVFVVIDLDNQIEGEITDFNNAVHTTVQSMK